ncbi:type VI secretion system protein VasG [Rhodobacter aestuarii]|uniref:Type VI secretion system protein VasG n=1 Tax=Rhodobacter aestuarii TaxID=453582 RepID=A0A1N7JVV4_9RHOB|nr:type VI secretion system ATPase TssH [Rhodobacter aestuarii]PTV95968.1 type VI secretion system protein VasG [Rhodobacter aestuarii]SIS53463.1 type VI secretion system protein VasG [Rhodobacter aestuarii]
MTEITIEKYAGKMNRAGYDAFIQAMRHARGEGNRHVEVIHWLFHALSNQNADIAVTLRETGVDRGAVLKSLDQAMARLQKNVTETPGISDRLADLLNHGWTYATLFFGEVQIRTGHMLLAALNDTHLKREITAAAPQLSALSADLLGKESRRLWAASEEEQMRPMDGSGLGSSAAGADGEGGPGAATALGRFSVDMTAEAEAGRLDPVVGRDDEIRQVIDILLRRRQNNPILTGEAGVGKTAVVEGFAQALAKGDVPPGLKGIRLHMLDIGAMQAGASMKGEFEQRLRSVIDEVQASPKPIILFIDEAHTLVGAGGAQGTGDAANLLKPALARGTLRTIGATTHAEYRNYFEKDPALTRRFQPVHVEEPTVDVCCYMLRGSLEPMEKHHGVRISDEAIVAAVKLSARYIPARQLPDKAVSLLDTASARVAVSQATTPARIADLRAGIAALDAEIAGKLSERDLGEGNEERLGEAETEKAKLEAQLLDLEAMHAAEKELVDKIVELRKSMVEPGEELDVEALRAEMMERMEKLAATNPDDRMVYAHVDEQAVASVISDWTGIPAGRMVADELQAILNLSETLKERVIGQDHGLRMIAKRIETSRAGLSNPNKPIGVFMLCGPSGVGKTETALALAEQLYGGEQNVITINMSEFQEAHSVSLLKGAPPGYVGYGEGGRLTEAVRRKPYSVVLLDEIEKAHPDVHELFFQVFDKGMMEDGNGRPINFRNTLILLTSNVGTEVVMQMADEGKLTPEPEVVEAALKPSLLKFFPPALLGRIVTIPYFPLSAEVLGGIARLKLGSVAKRLHDAHGAKLTYGQDVLDHIIEQCRDPDSGGRMIDNIITNSILPDLSRQVLGRMVTGNKMTEVEIGLKDGEFDYRFDGATAPGATRVNAPQEADSAVAAAEPAEPV